jgi:MFS transporter, SP family, sugar:H+ symporter
MLLWYRPTFDNKLTHTGGVTSMDDFLLKFFPLVYEKKKRAKEDNFCRYDNHKLQLFTSSLYLAALVSCLFASKMCRGFGRKITIQISSIFFFIGVVLNMEADNLHMLIAGRILLGIGIGFANQVIYFVLSCLLVSMTISILLLMLYVQK